MKRSRILTQNEKMRKLFWIGEEKDGSIYAGSYLTGRTHGTGSFTVPPGGKVHVSYSEGEFKDLKRETKIKTSFHPSGQTHMKTQDDIRDYLWMVKREELYKIHKCKEIVVILPKESKYYPVMDKKMNEGDIILPLKIFNNRPFVIKLYLAKKDFDQNILLSKELGSFLIAVWEGKLKLILIAYQNEETRRKGEFPPKEYWLFKR